MVDPNTQLNRFKGHSVLMETKPLVHNNLYGRYLVSEYAPALIVLVRRGECTRLETAHHARSAESTVAL